MQVLAGQGVLMDAELAAHSTPHSTNMWTHHHDRLLKHWHKESKRYQKLHYYASDYYRRWDNYIGIPKIIISTVVGTSMFATVNTAPNTMTQVAQASVVIFSAILSAIHQKLNYGSLSERHSQASSCYATVCMSIEKELSVKYKHRTHVDAVLSSLYSELDHLNKICPQFRMRQSALDVLSSEDINLEITFSSSSEDGEENV